MKPLFLVDDELCLPSRKHLAALEKVAGLPLPESYRAFLTTYGAGTYDDVLEIWPPKQVADDHDERSAFLKAYSDFLWPESETVLPLEEALISLEVARSLDGDELRLHAPSGRLFVLPRHDLCVFEVPAGFDDPLDWPDDQAYEKRDVVTFVPRRQTGHDERIAQGLKRELTELFSEIEAVLGGSKNTKRHVVSCEEDMIGHFGFSRARFQLSCWEHGEKLNYHYHLEYNAKYPEVPEQAIERLDGLGFRYPNEI